MAGGPSDSALPSSQFAQARELTLLPLVEGGETLPSIPLPDRYSQNPNTRTLLSPELRMAAANYDWNSVEQPRVLTSEEVNAVTDQVLKLLQNSNFAYHNFSHTADAVLPQMEALMAAIKIPDPEGGMSRYLTLSEYQLGQLAALFHDFRHSGNTYRQLQSALGFNDRQMFSNEEAAAIYADEMLKNYLTVPQRIELQGMILATSFGQRDEKLFPAYANAEFIKRDYAPTTWTEKLLAFADIANFKQETRGWFEENFRVFEEMPDDRIPKTFESMLDTRVGFLDKYVRLKLDDISSLFDHNRTLLDSYRDRLEELLNEVKSLYLEPEANSFGQWLRGAFQQFLAQRGLANQTA